MSNDIGFDDPNLKKLYFLNVFYEEKISEEGDVNEEEVYEFLDTYDNYNNYKRWFNQYKENNEGVQRIENPEVPILKPKEFNLIGVSSLNFFYSFFLNHEYDSKLIKKFDRIIHNFLNEMMKLYSSFPYSYTIRTVGNLLKEIEDNRTLDNNDKYKLRKILIYIIENAIPRSIDITFDYKSIEKYSSDLNSVFWSLIDDDDSLDNLLTFGRIVEDIDIEISSFDFMLFGLKIYFEMCNANNSQYENLNTEQKDTFIFYTSIIRDGFIEELQNVPTNKKTLVASLLLSIVPNPARKYNSCFQLFKNIVKSIMNKKMNKKDINKLCQILHIFIQGTTTLFESKLISIKSHRDRNYQDHEHELFKNSLDKMFLDILSKLSFGNKIMVYYNLIEGKHFKVIYNVLCNFGYGKKYPLDFFKAFDSENNFMEIDNIISFFSFELYRSILYRRNKDQKEVVFSSKYLLDTYIKQSKRLMPFNTKISLLNDLNTIISNIDFIVARVCPYCDNLQDFRQYDQKRKHYQFLVLSSIIKNNLVSFFLLLNTYIELLYRFLTVIFTLIAIRKSLIEKDPSKMFKLYISKITGKEYLEKKSKTAEELTHCLKIVASIEEKFDFFEENEEQENQISNKFQTLKERLTYNRNEIMNKQVSISKEMKYFNFLAEEMGLQINERISEEIKETEDEVLTILKKKGFNGINLLSGVKRVKIEGFIKNFILNFLEYSNINQDIFSNLKRVREFRNSIIHSKSKIDQKIVYNNALILIDCIISVLKVVNKKIEKIKD